MPVTGFQLRKLLQACKRQMLVSQLAFHFELLKFGISCFNGLFQ